MPATEEPIDRTLMDESVSPADDFYAHANGGWLAANPVPPEYGAWGAFQQVHVRNEELLHRLLTEAADKDAPSGSAARMVGDYFAAGMDEARIADVGTRPLQPLLQRIAAVASVDDVRAVTGELQRHGVHPLHSFGFAPDFEDANAYLAYVGQGGLGLPDRDYYSKDDERSVAIRDAYVGHVATQLGNLGDEADVARTAAEAILAFETQLAEASLPREKLRDPRVMMNRHAVDTLDELMPRFRLTEHVRGLGVTLPGVNIDNAEFFRALDNTLAETPIEVVRSYLRWHLVRASAAALPPAFETAAFEFYGRTLGGQKEQQPRWKRVLAAAGADIGELVAQLYVDAAFSAEAKARCETLVRHLLSAMERAIRGAEWMTEPTREEALTKLAGFTFKIGYPDAWRDYTGLRIDRSSFVENRMRSASFELDRELRRQGDAVDKAEWAMPAHVVNAYYNPLLNEIVFPAGILQPPMFWADADDAVNYGAIGTVIGHEVTHGFDDQGSRYDAKGSLRNWWSDEDRTEFERRANVIVEQFSGFQVPGGQHVNGKLTLGENIADLGGLAIAFDALHEALGDDEPTVDGLSPAQRFFMSYATIWRMNYTDQYAQLLVNIDPHAPSRYRVNGPLSNFPAFAETFDVPADAPMSRTGDDLVKIW